MLHELLVLESAVEGFLETVARGPPSYLIGYSVGGKDVRRFICFDITHRRPSRRGSYSYIPLNSVQDFQRIKLMRPPFIRHWVNFRGRLELEEWFRPHIEVYGPELQAFIAALNVAVIGVGRSGSEVVLGLLKEGYRRLILVDKDVVESRNRHLHVYAEAPEGTPKVEALERYIHSRFSHVEVTSLFGDVTELINSGEASSLADADIAFCAVDEVPARAAVSLFCSHYGIPLIELGTSIRLQREGMPNISGRITVSIPGRNCLFCMGIITDKDLEAGRDQRERFYGDATFSGVLANEAVITLKQHLIGSPNANISYISPRGITHRQITVASYCPFCRPEIPRQSRGSSARRTEQRTQVARTSAGHHPEGVPRGDARRLLLPALLSLALLGAGIWALISVPLLKELLALGSTIWFIRKRNEIWGVDDG